MEDEDIEKCPSQKLIRYYFPPKLSIGMNLLFLSPFIQEEILLSSKSFLHQRTINNAHKISQELLWDKQKELWFQNRDKER